jgi:hypothetical protein
LSIELRTLATIALTVALCGSIISRQKSVALASSRGASGTVGLACAGADASISATSGAQRTDRVCSATLRGARLHPGHLAPGRGTQVTAQPPADAPWF